MKTKLITVYQINNKPVDIPMKVIIYQGENLYEKVKQILKSKGFVSPIRELYFTEGTHPNKKRNESQRTN